MILSRLFEGRLSPANQPIPTLVLCDRDAPEASLGSGKEDGSVQANVQRSIRRTQARHLCCVTATKEEALGPQDYKSRQPGVREASRAAVQSRREKGS